MSSDSDLFTHTLLFPAKVPVPTALPSPTLASKPAVTVPTAKGGGDCERPEPGKLRISQVAVEGRMRRLFTPNTKGEYKVSAEIVKQWWTKKGRKNLQQLFQSCGFNPDCWG